MSAAFIEQADYEKGFASYFNQHIDPLLDNLEADRRNDLQLFINSSVLGAFAVVAVFLLLFYGGAVMADPHLQYSIDNVSKIFSKHGRDVGEGKVKMLFFAVTMAIIYPGMIYRRYAGEAKTVLLPPLLKFFGELQYFSLSNFSEDRIEPFSIVPDYTSYESENNVSGALDNVQLDLAEIKLVRGSGKNRMTVFRGLATILQMPKPFKGKTIIKHNPGAINKWLEGKVAGLESVSLEDPNFDKKFEVYSSDQVEARYLLNPAFMERLLDMAALMGNWGKNPAAMDHRPPVIPSAYGGLRCSFFGNSLLLLIPCHKDLFAPGNLFYSAFRIDEIRCVLYQVYLLRRIIEILKLDQRSDGKPSPAPAAGMVPHVKTPDATPSHPLVPPGSW